MTHVRPSIRSDCFHIANNLRSADLDELSLWDVGPEQALVSGFEESLQPLTVIHESMPCAMFGVTAHPVTSSGLGIVWLLGTDDLFSARVPFLKQSGLWLKHSSRPFSNIGNWVDSRNVKHIRWLRWLGFEVTDKIIVKNTEVLFHHMKVA